MSNKTINRVAAKQTNPFTDIVRTWIIGKSKPFTVDDIRKDIPEQDLEAFSKSIGGVMCAMRYEKIIIYKTHITTTNKRAHGRPLAQWLWTGYSESQAMKRKGIGKRGTGDLFSN